MRITGWHIDGFGVFTDTTVLDLPPDLTVVLGPNEAGKSTLLAFLRGVLFGFDGGRSDRDYPPLYGGRHGGSVFVSDGEGGTAVVERHRGAPRARVTLADGSTGTEADLARLVGYADAEVFRNLFAFSLTELESLRTLDTEAVRERIVTAGVVGAGRSARSAVARLDRRRDLSYRPRGATAEIPRLAEALRGAEARLRAAQDTAAGYERARELQQRWAGELERLTRALADRRETSRRAQTLLDLWPDWSEADDAHRRLAELDDSKGVGEDAEARLERLLSDVATARALVAERRQELGVLERRLGETEPDDHLPPIAADLRSLYAELSAHVGRLTRLAAAEHGADELRARLDEELARLGTGWDRERVAGFDPSFPAMEQIRVHETRMEQAQAAHRAADQALKEADEHRATLADEQRRLSGELRRHASTPTPEQLDEDDATIRRLRASLAEHGLAAARAEAAGRSLDDLRTSMPGTAVPFLGLPAWLRPALILLGVALAAGCVAALVDRQFLVAFGAGISAVAVAAVAVALRPRALTAASPRAALNRAQRQERLRAAEGEVDERTGSADRLRDEVAVLAARLELQPLPTPLELEERDALADRQRAARAEAERASAAMVEVGARLREAERDLTARREQLGQAGDEHADTLARWADWKAEHGVPEALGPRAALELMGGVDHARALTRQLEPLEREAEQLRAATGQFERRAAGVLVRAGAERGAPFADLVRAVTLLTERLNRDEAVRRDRTLLTAERDTARGRLAAAEQRGTAAETELVAFLSLVGADEVGAARERIAVARRRRELEARAAAAEQRVGARIGSGAPADALLAEVADRDVGGWRAQRAEADADLVHLEEQREQAVRRQHDAARDVAALERSADVPAAAVEREGLRAELADAVAEWQSLSLARALVSDTLRRFERERQPAVMARASALFSQVTQGRYEQVVVAEDGLEVLDEGGARFDTAELSRGTAEQLYLCIRFGLAAEFAARAAPLPLVMDDVLVNFDPERANGVAQAIDSVASEHQVLLFTCHPNVVDLLVGVRPGTRVIELQRRAAAGPDTMPT